MSYKISKELFEKVSEHKVDEIKVVDVYIQIYKGTAMIRVSIYEFFFKCKEWVIKQGYLLISSFGYCSIHIDDTNTNICEITS